MSRSTVGASSEGRLQSDWNEVDEGGHFAAWEQPRLVSEEIQAAFRSLR
jgi:pimeloyl-ACP methyl ester carboxylesterase